MSNLTLPTIVPEFTYAESEHVEPGLLSVFRLFIGLHILLLLTGALFALFLPAGVQGFDPPLRNGRRGVWLDGFYLVELIGLFAYLSWPRLQKNLGRFYLPIALVITSLAPVVELVAQLYMALPHSEQLLIEAHIVARGWRLLIVLLVPLVLTAWQYDFRRVLIFSIGVTLFDLVLSSAVLNMLDIYRPSLVMGMSIARMLTFILVGYVVARMMRVQREQRNFLTKANMQLARYASTLEQLTVSRERNRLARELHDTLAHTLSAVSVQLEAVDSVWDIAPEKSRELLHKSLAQTRSGLTETRRALQALRASPLEDLGLALAVRNLAEVTAKRAGLELDLSVPPKLENISPDVEQGIYRVAQEALENVVKHAAASRVRVALNQQDDAVTLTIQDNGRGFAQNGTDRAERYGLRGMQERADMMGAQLDVRSHKSSGTTVQLVWPMT